MNQDRMTFYMIIDPATKKYLSACNKDLITTSVPQDSFRFSDFNGAHLFLSYLQDSEQVQMGRFQVMPLQLAVRKQ